MAARVHPTAVVLRLERAADGMIDHERPHDVAVAAHHRVRAATFTRLIWIQRRVYAAKHDRGPSRSSGGADFITAERIAGVNPNPDDVARMHALEIKGLERLVDDAWAPVCGGCGRAQHEQPARRDHADTEGQMTGVHQVDGHRSPRQTEETVASKTKCVKDGTVNTSGSCAAARRPRKLGG